MAEPQDQEPFTFTWLALQLLGRGLYSNPWSALSELVANGLDAGATLVRVFIDLRSSGASTIEVFDNGSGMSREDIATYVRVGYNKREDPAGAASGEGSRTPTGRKGIGKLAALYLSRDFFLRTKRAGSDTTWRLDARDGHIADDDLPALLAVSELPPSENLEGWTEFESGTFLRLNEVDLSGYGEQSVVALSARLANQFLLQAEGPRVELFVRNSSNAEEPATFRRVEKEVAFKNFAYVGTNFGSSHPEPIDLSGALLDVTIPVRGLRAGVYVHTPEVFAFTASPSVEDDEILTLSDEVDFDAKLYLGRSYSLEGWIGIHSTIKSEAARENDSRFKKNKYYNPAQIRVYVRGKLASDRLLGQLGITGTYLNYVEGELSFDLLDIDDLPDIATSNRQDFDETDDRVLLLRALVRPLVRGLIQRRNDLASRIADLSKEEKARAETAGKAAFVRQLERDLDTYDDIPQEVKDELQLVVANKVKGDVVAKDKFRIFISHSRDDKHFADLIYELLLHQGATPDEIFYTSKTGGIDQYADPRALGAVIKENITSSNTLIFYLTSRNFKASEFCLFEGGAGWATRAVTEYLKLNVEYAAVPTFLSNGQAELQLIGGGVISLTPEIHNYLIERVLNPMIVHLNEGRTINETSPIKLFDPVVFPTEVESLKAGKTAVDYYDATVVEHWETHVAPHVAEYLSAYPKAKN